MLRKKYQKGVLGFITALCFIIVAFIIPDNQAFAADGVADKAADYTTQSSEDSKEVYIAGLANDVADSITSVKIPSEIDGKPVTKIVASAFNNNKKITELVVPDSVTEIGINAFNNCSNLKEVTIPVDINTVNCFNGCGATEKITYTYGKTGKMLDRTNNGDLYFSYTLEYRSSSLTTVVFDDKISHIGDYAFYNQGQLVNVTLPNNEITVGNMAFQNCNNLQSIDMSNIISYGVDAFNNCRKLNSININKKVEELPQDVFYNCKSLEDITIPENVKILGKNAFAYCEGLKKVTIPVDLKTYYVFGGCSNIEEIVYTKGKTCIMHDAEANDANGYYFTQTLAYRSSKLSKVTFEKGITHIGDYALYNQTTLTEVNMPDEVSVGKYSFCNCKAITFVDTSKVISYGEYAFDNCKMLDGVVINENVTELPERVFSYCDSLSKIVIPENVEILNRNAFGNDSGLKKVTIPVDLKTYYVFSGCTNIEEIVYTKGKTCIMHDSEPNDVNGYYYLYTLAYRSNNLTKVTFEDGIKHIGDYALINQSKLVEVNMPNNGYTIGNRAFCDAKLANIDVSNATEIEEYAFNNCAGITEININEAVNYIPDHAFYGCAGITKLVIPDTVTRLGTYAFAGCNNIEEVVLPIDLEYVDNSFSNYGNCTKVTYTEGITGDMSNNRGAHDARYSLEARLDNIKTVIFEKGVKNICKDAFYQTDNRTIENVKFAKSVEYVDSAAFVSGLNATFYGFKDSVVEKHVSNVNDESLTFRPLLYPQVTEGPTDTELGNDYQYSAFVYTDIDTEETVTEWSVKDSNSKKTVIDETGKLTVGDNEKSRDIKVCASYDEYTVEIPVKVNRTKFIVEFNAGKGEASEDALATTDDKKLSSLPTAAYDYYTFDGWFTAEEDGDEVTTETVFEDDAIVYAHYSKTPVESIDIKAGAQPKSGVAFDTTVKSVSDNVDADSVNVSYMSDDKAAEGNARCEVAYTAKVTFKLKNGYTNSDKTVLKINDSEVQLKKIDGGKYEGVVSFKATTHGETVLKGAKEATKTEEGYTGDKCCSICNEILERGKVIPKLTDDKKADDKKTEEKTTEKKPAETPAGDGVGTISADGKILTDTTGKKYYVAAKVTAAQLKANLMVADKKSGGKYKITKLTKNKKTKKVTGGTVTYMAPYNRNCTKATMPEFVKIAGVKFKVTALNKDAFKNCKKIKTVTIGKNITKIGANAFSGCAKLQSVSIKATGLKSIGGNAFKGISAKAKFKVPKKQYTKYSKMIKKAKAPKTAKISK